MVKSSIPLTVSLLSVLLQDQLFTESTPRLRHKLSLQRRRGRRLIGGVGCGRRDEREVILEGLSAPRLGHRRRLLRHLRTLLRLFRGREGRGGAAVLDGIPGAELEVVLLERAKLPATQVRRVEHPLRL